MDHTLMIPDLDLTVKCEVSYEARGEGPEILVGDIRIYWLDGSHIADIPSHDIPAGLYRDLEERCNDEYNEYCIGLAEQAAEALWERQSADEDAQAYPRKFK